MADVTFSIPDVHNNRVLNAFANQNGWTPELGVTKLTFFKQQIIKHVKQTVKNDEGNTAAGIARNTVETDVEAINIT